jgi:hypothetical protein
MFMVDSSQPKNAQLHAREIKNKAPKTANFTRIELSKRFATDTG